MTPPPYVGRFAPSPSGPLHAGSLVAALASWLDARAHDGQWLVRIEDVDTPRTQAGADQVILKQLSDCGLQPDRPPVWQSARFHLYQQSLQTLISQRLAYPCACSRQEVHTALERLGHARQRHHELVYPGTCRLGLAGRPARAWRLHTTCADGPQRLDWADRRLGAQSQVIETEVGDFILKRADGCFAYQLAVVVDDGLQGVTDVVRGEDLSDNTARQIHLQRALGLPTPRYLHSPLVRDDHGDKLSKQNGAQAVDTGDALGALNAAADVLGLSAQGGPTGDALQAWTNHWRALHRPLYNPAP